MIQLEAGDWRAVLNPALGGSITELGWRDRPVLRSTPAGANDPLQTACFPLVPYANRIADGRFTFDDEAYNIGGSPGFEPHALHGVGWRRSWTAEAVGSDEAVLSMRHPGDASWPWAFSARQLVRLTEDGLHIALSMTNTGDRIQPAGLGLHPYFPRFAGDRLSLTADRVWRIDDALIPRDLVPAPVVFDWREGPAVKDAPFVDHAYGDWTGSARLAHADWTVTLASPGTRRVHVYAPQDAGFLCLEPVTHRPNALNAPAAEESGLVILKPDETLTLSMTIGAGS